ncbi:MAG: hypothetical protein LBQ88_09205 [Treponema sp.]|nr:hypothetical protein [Treponema sp.]
MSRSSRSTSIRQAGPSRRRSYSTDALNAINARDERNEYTITLTGSFSAAGVSFAANGMKTITIKGDARKRSITNGTNVALALLAHRQPGLWRAFSFSRQYATVNHHGRNTQQAKRLKRPRLPQNNG